MQEELTTGIEEESSDIADSSIDINVTAVEELEETEIIDTSVGENDTIVIEENDTNVIEESSVATTTIVEESSVAESNNTESNSNLHDSSSLSSDSSAINYSEYFQEVVAEQQITNDLLYRVNQQNDLIIGIGVTLIICCIAYSVLEKFCRF